MGGVECRKPFVICFCMAYIYFTLYYITYLIVPYFTVPYSTVYTEIEENHREEKGREERRREENKGIHFCKGSIGHSTSMRLPSFRSKQLSHAFTVCCSFRCSTFAREGLLRIWQ